MVPLTYDFSFKRVFELNPELLKTFLFKTLELYSILEIKKSTMKFVPTELSKTTDKEYKKTVDIYVILNKNVHIDIEMNTKDFNDIRLRNFMYADKINSLLLEKGEDYHLLNERYLYQLNLNVKEKYPIIGEDIIVPYGIKSKTVYNDNKKIVLKYLAYYRQLYYNNSIKKESDIWLAMLTAKTFTELYEILDKVVTPKERDKFIGDVINMSKDEFILHEWEKEKLDALVENEMKKNSFNEGHAEGLSEGMSQEKLEIAKAMLNENTDIEFICKVTGLKKEEIEALK